MKKIWSVLILSAILVSMLAGAAVSAQTEAPSTWDGSIASAFAGGDGTEANPYLISNGAELALLQAKIANVGQAAEYFDKSYKLTADIVLNEGDAATWADSFTGHAFTPIGVWNNTISSFGGHFDGDGHTISGLYITNTYESGVGGIDGGIALFGCIQGGARIENLALVNAYIESTNTGGVGAIVGQTDRSSEEDVTISNVYSDAILVGAGTECGGIIGNLSNSKADGSFISGRVRVDRATFTGSVYGTNYVGGIIGNARNVGVTVTNCLVYGSVSAGGSYAAGILTKSKSDEDKTPTGDDLPTVSHCIVAGTEVLAGHTDESKRYNRAYVAQSSSTSAYKTAVNNCFEAIGIDDVKNGVGTDNEDVAVAQLYGSYDGTGAIDWVAWSADAWVCPENDIIRPKGVAENLAFAPQEVLLTEFTVTWMNGEEVLATETYSVGEMPEYKGEEPTKAEDEHYIFTFNRWTPELKAVTEDATYTAEFFRTRKTATTTVTGEDTSTGEEPSSAGDPGASDEPGVTENLTDTTDAPTTTDAKDPDIQKGCNSALGGCVAAIVTIVGVCAVAVRKKGDDNLG